jgi:homogentisate 1,2-dioxygenase
LPNCTDRFFYNTDGEMLIVPQQGRAHFVTEPGIIAVAPGEVAVIPRGLRRHVAIAPGVIMRSTKSVGCSGTALSSRAA